MESPLSPGSSSEPSTEQEILRLREEVAALKISLVAAQEQSSLSRTQRRTGTTNREQLEADSVPGQDNPLQHDLQDIFMQAPLAICVIDGPDHVFSLVNPRYKQLVKREVFGKKARDAFSTAEVGPFFDLLDQVYQTGEPHVGREKPVPLMGTDGRVDEQFIDFYYHPLRSYQGQVTAILAFHIDVTEQVHSRKQIELSTRELMAEKHKLLAIVDQVPGAVTIFDGPDHVFSLASETYLSLFFGGRKDLIGKSVREAVPEAEAQGFVALLDRVYQKGEPISGKETPVDLKQADGTMKSFYINFEYQPLRIPGEGIKGVVAVVVDVTEQVQIKQELKKVNRDLLDERDQREYFVAALSHDLRNPVTAAKMCAQLLGRNFSEPLMMQKLSGRIVENMERLDQMIRDLLDVTRIKAGEPILLNVVECDLNELLQATLEDLVSIHGDRFVLKAKSNVRVRWDRPSMKRVIENIVNNAVKYGAPNAPITLTIEQRESVVEISIHNEGFPISPGDQATLFVRFRRSESAEKNAQKGWGIGLTLVRGVVEAHGGQVHVKSSEDKGTTFFVRIPQYATSVATTTL